jgi:hypothetical protein
MPTLWKCKGDYSQDAISDITRACFGGHIINSSIHRCREFLELNLQQARCNVLAFHYKMGSKRAATEEPIVAPGESKKPKTENITRRALGRPPIRALSLSSYPRPRFPQRLSPALLLHTFHEQLRHLGTRWARILVAGRCRKCMFEERCCF